MTPEMIDKRRETKRRWRLAHPDQCREYTRKYQSTHREKTRERSRRWRAAHPEKAIEVDRKYKVTHPEKIRESTRKWYINNRKKAIENSRKQSLKKYGLSPDEWLKLRKEQGGKCKICGTCLDKSRSVHTDHDHKTGRIRGILCTNCNTGLGLFKDDPVLLKKAMQYLTKATAPGPKSGARRNEMELLQ